MALPPPTFPIFSPESFCTCGSPLPHGPFAANQREFQSHHTDDHRTSHPYHTLPIDEFASGLPPQTFPVSSPEPFRTCGSPLPHGVFADYQQEFQSHHPHDRRTLHAYHALPIDALASGYVLTPEYRVMNLPVHVDVFTVPCTPDDSAVWLSIEAIGLPIPFLIVPVEQGQLHRDMAEWVVHAALRSIVLNDYIVMGPDTHLRLAFDAHAFSMFDSYCRSPPNVVSRTQSAWADSLRYHALEQFA